MAPETGCSCGCGEMTVVTEATDPCACGCECCGKEEPARDEVAQLMRLRASVDRRLAELGAPAAG